MENYDKVSVVVPVYNVEKYLSKCLESICEQTYPFLEVIVVDDSSPDNSGAIADKFAENDNRVKVFHIKNRGAAGARNYGLDKCTGDYVFFVDSDDWIDKYTLEMMVNTLTENQVDVVQCQYIDEYKDSSVNHKCDFVSESFSDEEFIKDMIPHWENILIWNKLYKAHLFHNVRFVEGHCIDDEFFTYRVIMNASKVIVMNDYLYHYRMRKSSAMGDLAKENQRHIDQVDFVTERYTPLSNAYPKLIPNLLEHLAEVLMSVMRNSYGYDETKHYAKSKLKKYFWKIITNKNVSINIKKSVVTYLFKKNIQVTVPNKEKSSQDNYFE